MRPGRIDDVMANVVFLWKRPYPSEDGEALRISIGTLL